MTDADLVFGRQEWLGELDGTPFADRVISMVTDRSAPELPGGDPDPDHTTATEEHHGRDRRGRSWPELSDLRERWHAAGRARRSLTGTTSSVLNLDPFEAGIRGQVDVGITAVDPDAAARPGLDLRMAVTAVHERRPTTSAGTAPSSARTRSPRCTRAARRST